MEFCHIPVMPGECMDGLNIRPDGLYVDCTVGGGGHSFEIAKRLGEGGRLICIDRDEEAICAAKAKLAPFEDRIRFVHGNFSDIENILGGEKPDGVLIDLGVSSYQVDNASRGFSYNLDAPLDMRMDRNEGKTAFDVVNNYSEEELADIIFRYGEERFSRTIARRIAERRKERPIETTLDLAELIKNCVPRPKDGGNPAKKTFQALRIEVNGELEIIEPTVNAIVSCLNREGRICVITFHSLEDKIVKQALATLAKGCTCPPDFPVCVCGKKPQINIISRKPVTASLKECAANPRSHSAKLRIAEKL